MSVVSKSSPSFECIFAPMSWNNYSQPQTASPKQLFKIRVPELRCHLCPIIREISIVSLPSGYRNVTLCIIIALGLCICGEFTTEVSIIAECLTRRTLLQNVWTKSSGSNRDVITGLEVVRSGITISLELTHLQSGIDTSQLKGLK